MALDNIQLDNLVAGDDVVTDLISSEHYQVVKHAFGAAGTANLVTSTATNPFPVALSDTDNTALDAVVTATEATQASVEIIDNAVSGAGFNTTQLGGVNINLGEGIIATGTQRVSLATDDDAVASLASIAASVGGNYVDDTPFTLGTDEGVMMMGFAGTQSVDANDAGAIAMETDGSVHIHDGGNSITVDGTVTANPASGTIDTVTTVTTANLAAETTKVIGTVRMASGGVASGSFASGALAAGAVTDLPLPSGAATSSGQLADGHSVALSATDNAVLDDIAAKLAPNTTNGHSFYLNQDTSAVASVKASAGTIYWLSVQSTDATPVYLNLYNVASGSVTLGTTTPSMQFIIPSQGDANGAGLVLNFGPLGIQFGTAITVAAATTFDGLTDPGTNVVITNIGFE